MRTEARRSFPLLLARAASSCGAALLGACSGGTPLQSPLHPAGDQASGISGLWWFYFAVLIGVFTLVAAAILTVAALHWRAQSARMTDAPVSQPEPLRERRAATVITGAVLATTAILFVLLFMSFLTGRAVSSTPPPDAITIRITGHQWWWEVVYDDPVPSKHVGTSNELHIPIGRPVRFDLQSVDVIHSFWVPNLHGKKDLIPGHPTSTWFVARKPGVYYGQCAEFCGYQHAHMRLRIVAEEWDKFAAWLDAQRQPAPEPQTDSQKRGRQVFLGSTCIMCHTIQGTIAHSAVGPDLTHVASRERLGAGAIPNNRGYLGGWILDPQTLKPGVHMPQNSFSGEELNALLDYLETLK